jgi:hypothetical protein
MVGASSPAMTRRSVAVVAGVPSPSSPTSILLDQSRAESHQEDHEEVGEAGDGLERSESRIISPELETESASLRLIGALPARFLWGGWRGRRGGSSGVFSSTRGSLERWRHGKVEVVMRGFSPSFAHKEEKRERVEGGKWRRRGWERGLGFACRGALKREGEVRVGSIFFGSLGRG